MPDIRSHGTYVSGTDETDFIQGYNVPGNSGDFGASQILTGFSSTNRSLYGLGPSDTTASNYIETLDPVFDGNDSILGGMGNDTLLGGGGNDTLIGGAPGGEGNNDVLYGGWGDDTLVAGNGAQTTDGGDDTLRGGPGNDILYGMDGDDIIEGDGVDPLYYPQGVDVAVYPKPRDEYVITVGWDYGLGRAVWYIKDTATSDVDTVSSVEYLFFNTPVTPSLSVASATIATYLENPGQNPNVMKLVFEYLYLNFYEQVPLDFWVTPVTFPVTLQTVQRDFGTEPLGNFTEPQRRAIVEGVQLAFNDSGVYVVIVDGWPPAGFPAHQVRFSSEDHWYDHDGLPGTDLHRLWGTAFQGVDRFNERPDDIVAVLMDGSDNLSMIIQTIAHEAGHGFGLRHINPEMNALEVMDYDWGDNPTFVNSPVNIIEPGTGPGTGPSIYTHNPVFHLRYYLHLDSYEGLLAANVSPGTWDLDSYFIANYSLAISTLTEALSSISIVYTGQGVAFDSPGSTFGIAQLLAVNVSAGDIIAFEVPEGQSFRIVGALTAGGTIDMAVSFETESGFTYELSAAPSGFLSGSILTGSQGGPVVTLGTVQLTVSSVRSVDADFGLEPLAGTRAADFDGDGRDDVLWRNTDGTLSNWLGTSSGGFAPNDVNAAVSVSTAWHVVGTGDFNGDGRDDILWRNTDGQLSNWLGQATGGFTPNDGNAALTVATDWQVVGTGDFDGDGRDDILWRNVDGTVSDWLGQANGGFTPNDVNAARFVPTEWHVVGTGDFNGDGRDDILWRNDNGQLSDWLGQANGGFILNDAVALTTVPTAWFVAGTGDFNGDGRDDILWRSNDGQLSNWLGQANGGFIPNDANAAIRVPVTWAVVATGDFNGDGRDDILWRSTDGTLSNWLGAADGGFTTNDANAATLVPTTWHVQSEPFVV